MEPVTTLLILVVAAKMVTTHREDLEYARQGKDSPRYKLKLARYQAARRAGDTTATPPARVGASGYMRDLWDDCWADLGEHRQRARQARKDKQAVESAREWSRRSLNRRPDGRPVDDMLDVAGVRPTDREPGWSGPEPVESGGPEPEWMTPDLDIEDGPTSVVHDEHPYCLTPCGPTCTAPRRLSGHGWRCGTCGQNRAGFGTEADARADAAKHPCRPNPDAASPREKFDAAWKQLADAQGDDDPSLATCDGCQRRFPAEQVARSTSGQRLRDGGTEWPGALCKQCRYQRALTIANDREAAAREFAQNGPVWAPKTPADERDSSTGGEQLATVIPLFPSTKETVMSNGTDTTGLSTAVAFAEQAASAHRSFATAGTEGYTNALVGFEVGEGCVSSARAAQEASEVAAAKWAAHLEELKKQFAVKEAYLANPDAGNRTFLLSE